jgi:anaerobic ribonucleoside-triphosphate reductase activating protein
LRLVIFLQGCPHKCEGCHNPETHPIDGGNEMSETSIINIIHKNPLLSGITISGGEPFLQSTELKSLLHDYKFFSFDPFGIWVYTGFTWEQILETESYRDLLPYVDVIVDGLFDRSLKTSERWKGSSNQRIIDVKKSLDSGNIILWNQ